MASNRKKLINELLSLEESERPVKPDWPKGTGTAEYDLWSPMIFNYTTISTSDSYATSMVANDS